MTPSFRRAEFEMPVRPCWWAGGLVGRPDGKGPGATAVPETTRGQQILGGVRDHQFLCSLTCSPFQPYHRPPRPTPQKPPASKPLLVSPSRLIAPSRLPREKLKGSPLHCTCCSLGSQNAACHPPGLLPTFLFLLCPQRTLVPPVPPLFLDCLLS